MIDGACIGCDATSLARRLPTPPVTPPSSLLAMVVKLATNSIFPFTHAFVFAPTGGTTPKPMTFSAALLFLFRWFNELLALLSDFQSGGIFRVDPYMAHGSSQLTPLKYAFQFS